MAGRNQRARGLVRRPATIQSDHGEEHHADQLRPHRQVLPGHPEAGDAEERGRPRRRAPPTTREEHEHGCRRRQRGAEQRDRVPSSEPVDHRQEHFGSPLLVQPLLARHGEREHVGAEQRVRSQHDVAGTDLVRKIDGRHLAHERGDQRRGDHDHDPHVCHPQAARRDRPSFRLRYRASYPHRAHVLCFGGGATPPERMRSKRADPWRSSAFGYVSTLRISAYPASGKRGIPRWGGSFYRWPWRLKPSGFSPEGFCRGGVCTCS